MSYFYPEMNSILLKITVLLGALVVCAGGLPPAGDTFRCENGRIVLKSEAPLEVIQARSSQLRGILDPERQTFAWTVEVSTFDGFNSPLQREHFNENYMETTRFPKATFSGKIIEEIDFTKNGIQSVRAKGKLNIHGVEQERIVKGQLEIKGNKIRIQAKFTVSLADHDIAIPKVVYQKIAEEITVTVEAELVNK
ncbi:MAG: YceI family protein [Lewinellaceae bacterium]|nr:YceI family protein [Lewinellaceae bacterium]